MALNVIKQLRFSSKLIVSVFVVSLLFSLNPVKAAASCDVSSLGIASSYNVFTFGNVNQKLSDTQGKMAIGGSAVFSDYSVGLTLPNSNGSRDDLIVNGNVDFKNGKVENGNLIYGGTSNLTNVDIPNGTSIKKTVIDFSHAKTSLTALSNTLAGYYVNGKTTVANNIITLNGINSQTNVFTINSIDLNGINNLSIDVPSGSSVLINISGSSVHFSNMSLSLNGAKRNDVLFNMYQSLDLTIQSIAVEGSVLAPNANVTFTNSLIEGQLVAETLKSDTIQTNTSGQFNNYLFEGCFCNATIIQTPTPSPIISTSQPPVSTIPVVTTTAPVVKIPAGKVLGTSTTPTLAVTGQNSTVFSFALGVLLIICMVLINYGSKLKNLLKTKFRLF